MFNQHCQTLILLVKLGIEQRIITPWQKPHQMVKLENNMRKILLAAAFSIAATSLSAGSMATPTMEEPVVSASSSSGGTPFIILMLVLLGVAASG